MNFLISGNTDKGIKKAANQDSLSLRVMNTPQGRMVFALLCDGMGGLEKGEVASASVIRAFDEWVMGELPELCKAPIEDYVIRAQWESIILAQNERIKRYGAGYGIRLGTTVTAMLLTQHRYYIIHVGDSRAYEIYDGLRQITSDQTFVAREVALGNMTPQEAKNDPRRSVLLQCVGASNEVFPDMFFGETKTNAVYMLCCDGFIHEITDEEIYESFRPDRLLDEQSMNRASIDLIELNKQRQERDNITVALIRTY